MRVTVLRPGDLGPEQARRWAEFQHVSPVMLSPFLSLAFAQAVGRHRPGARVAVVEEAGEIQAFLPFELVSRTMAVPIGSPMNDLHGFIHSGAVIDARSVVKQAGLRGWRFGQAPAGQDALVPYHYAGTAADASAIDLSGGYESYFASRTKSLSTKITRQRRSLARRVGPVSLEWQSARPGESLRQLIAWKSGKYHGTKTLFSDPSASRILEQAGSAENEYCRGIVSVLRAGQRPVAINLGLTGPRGLTGWFAAYDPELSRFSPGTMLVLAVAEEAASRGITYFDLGYGQDSYKLRLANTSYPVAGGAVWVSRTERAARRLYRQLRGRSLPGEAARRRGGGLVAAEPAS
jgi:CelD/BcsL family acetyltransferase involved in cellulose biosynthesis